MEHSTANRPPASEPSRTDATKTGRTEKAHGDRHFESLTLPGLVSADLLIPTWLRKRFRRRAEA